jgi:recombinational DNA repair protein RecT
MSSAVVEKDREQELRTHAKVVDDQRKSIDVRAMSLCKVVDLRAAELTRGMDARIDKTRALELVKMIIREQSDKVVGCTLASVMRAAKTALLSGLVVDRFKGEVDFIPRNRKMKVDGKEIWVKELHADPNYRGLIHYVANTGKMKKPPFVEAVFEGEKLEFSGDADALKVSHVKNPLNEHRTKGDASKVVGYYARWYLDSGTVDHFLTRDEVIAHGRKYSKQYRDAESSGKKDSMWHKDEIKMCLKTLIRDAVNRDKVPISREDRGYVLGVMQAERAEASADSVGEVIDAEYSLAGEILEDAEPVAVDSTSMIESAPQEQPPAHRPLDRALSDETPRMSFERYEARLAEATTTKDCANLFAAFFGDGSPHPWTDEDRGLANELRAKRVDAIRGVTP